MRVRAALAAAAFVGLVGSTGLAGVAVVRSIGGTGPSSRSALPRWQPPNGSLIPLTPRANDHRASRDSTATGRTETSPADSPTAPPSTPHPGATLPAGTGPGPAVSAAWAPGSPLPQLLADTGGGSQLITAVSAGATDAPGTGTLSWWSLSGGAWVMQGSAPADFGVNGLSENRLDGDGTTPVGLFTLPLAFGTAAAPGTRMPWRAVDAGSWWMGNPDDPDYNSWVENCPPERCWESAVGPAGASERLSLHQPQYRYAVQIGFNAAPVPVRPPARPSGSGVFLHVRGPVPDAGGVSVDEPTMLALLRWLDPARTPHLAIGNADSIYRQ